MTVLPGNTFAQTMTASPGNASEPPSLPLLGLQGCRLRRRVHKVAPHELQRLVYEDDGEGEHDDQEPLVEGEGDDGEDAGQNRHVEDEEVQAEGERHGHQQPGVAPRRHLQQRVVLRSSARDLSKCYRFPRPLDLNQFVCQSLLVRQTQQKALS